MKRLSASRRGALLLVTAGPLLAACGSGTAPANANAFRISEGYYEVEASYRVGSDFAEGPGLVRDSGNMLVFELTDAGFRSLPNIRRTFVPDAAGGTPKTYNVYPPSSGYPARWTGTEYELTIDDYQGPPQQWRIRVDRTALRCAGPFVTGGGSDGSAVCSIRGPM